MRRGRMVRIRSEHFLRGLAKYRSGVEHYGRDGRRKRYRYLVPEDLVDRAIELGGSIDESEGEPNDRET